MAFAAPAEIAAIAAILVACVVLVVKATGPRAGTRGSPRTRRAVLALIAVSVAGASALLRLRAGGHGQSPPSPIGPTTTLGYVTSAACLPCHASEHASFARTYHRTMTRVATAETVGAPFERRGDEVWTTLPDPDLVIEGIAAPEVTRRILLVTGSHREEAYWVAGRRKGDLRLVPSVWLPREHALVSRRDAFLLPPDAPMPPVRWASSCIACHAVAGEPGHDLEKDRFDTRAAELGIACESCHGPGAAHVEHYRDPVARYAKHGEDDARKTTAVDPTIVHPGRIAPERSAAVCGQCHAYAFPKDEAGWWTSGYAQSFRAGDALEPSRTLLRPDAMHGERGAPVVDAPASAIFWPDGSVRVGGREYNGLVASPCYERGEGTRKLTCLSCHAMHAGDPAGQIAPDRTGNAACTTCHDSGRARTHAHHTPGSPGSACVDCHMPKTSFALLSAVRSHRIDSPRVREGMPNACNLCHLDRTLAWTAQKLSEWYGAKAALGVRDDVAVGLHDGLSADAGTRALVADALGARVYPAAFAAPVLDAMASDPYAAVRFVAARSRRRYPATPFPLDPAQLRALLAVRDDRAITIAE